MPTDSRSPEAVQKALRRMLPLLWRALEAGNQVAHSFFAEHGKPLNTTLYPCLVRWSAIEELTAAGVDATSEDDGAAREWLPNNGIAVRYGAFNIRVLKADRGEVPAAGRSARKREFYCQGRLLPQDDDAPLNFIVLWDYDVNGLEGLSLACPRHADSSKASVEIDWLVPLPHPAEHGSSTPPDSGGDDDDDLGITKPDEPGATEQHGS